MSAVPGERRNGPRPLGWLDALNCVSALTVQRNVCLPQAGRYQLKMIEEVSRVWPGEGESGGLPDKNTDFCGNMRERSEIPSARTP